jgi:signal transduction histidine kinase
MKRMFTVYGESQTWGAFAYCLIGFPLGIAGFVFAVTSLSVSAGLAVTLIGIPLLGISIAMARGFGAAYRGLGRTFLGIDVEKPTVHRRPGLLGYLGERNGWRAMLFLFIRFPLAIFDFVVAISLFAYAWGGVTYPIWWRASKYQYRNGTVKRGLQIGPHWFANTGPRIFAVFATGVLLALIGPWVVRGIVRLDQALIRGLLGPTRSELRIQSLEETRSLAVDDSAAALRRIERDLHDGAQARLVALAMSLGLAKEELDGSDLEGADPEVALARVRELVDSAHREAKGTIIDLRDLARGIHPPALDNGLPDALSTLTARSTVPTTLRIDLPDRPSPAVETIVYFCTAELLTNAAKHSNAHHASVDVRVVDQRLFIRVGDDGVGGAALQRSGGLSGLTDRVATVDGKLTIDSPDGGPTLVTVEIPL